MHLSIYREIVVNSPLTVEMRGKSTILLKVCSSNNG